MYQRVERLHIEQLNEAIQNFWRQLCRKKRWERDEIMVVLDFAIVEMQDNNEIDLVGLQSISKMIMPSN